MNLKEVLNESFFGTIQNGKIYGYSPPRDLRYGVVRVFVAFVIFFMGTAMMNIFIAVLSRCFEIATTDKLSLFSKRRALVTEKHHMMVQGLGMLVGRSHRGKRLLRSLTPDSMPDSWLWYFTPTAGMYEQ